MGRKYTQTKGESQRAASERDFFAICHERSPDLCRKRGATGSCAAKIDSPAARRGVSRAMQFPIPNIRRVLAGAVVLFASVSLHAQPKLTKQDAARFQTKL